MKKKIFALAALLFGIILFLNIYNAYAGTDKVYSNELEYGEAPADNPLMGFVSWGAIKSDFPHSLEYYSIPLNEVQNGYSSFDWSQVEACLNKCEYNGNQAVLRFYMDYPGKETGIPQFLIDDNLDLYSYEIDGDSGLCPDYSNKNLQNALVNFIKAFGEKYDGDPRIGFIQAGLLGFWGEWHTYPYTQWYPSYDVYSLIGKTYSESFKKTYFMIGEPEKSTEDLKMGFHDDMFAVDTYDYLEKLKENKLYNKWITAPVGAELAPYIQEKYFTTAIEEALDWNEAVQLIHPSWCLNSAIEKYSGSDKSAAIECAKSLGYKFFVQKAEVDTGRNCIKVIVNLSNIGTAPFYYDWNIKLRVEDVTDSKAYDFDTDWKLTSIKELNTTYTLDKDILDFDLVDNHEYKVYMKVINPMDGGKNLRFANKEQQSDGWLELIDFSS